MEQFLDAAKALVPGAVGAVSAAAYTRGGWIKRTANIFSSSTTVFYTYEWVASNTGLPTGFVSFFIGLFAAPFIDKAIEEIYELEGSQILMDWLRKLLRIS